MPTKPADPKLIFFKSANGLVLAGGEIFALICIFNSGGARVLSSAFGLFVIFLVSLPYAILGGLTWILPRWTAAMFALVGSIGIAGYGAFLYYQAFFADLDPQSALAFLFVPVYQLGGCLIVGILSWIVGLLL